MQFSGFYYLGLVLIGFHMFFIQIQRLVIDDSKNCLEIFKSNNLLGFIVLISLIMGKI
jgi:4-hydroxybenzoate polyprenyltransferase